MHKKSLVIIVILLATVLVFGIVFLIFLINAQNQGQKEDLTNQTTNFHNTVIYNKNQAECTTTEDEQQVSTNEKDNYQAEQSISEQTTEITEESRYIEPTSQTEEIFENETEASKPVSTTIWVPNDEWLLPEG